MPEDGDMGYVPMTGFANGQTGKYLLMSDIVVLDVIYRGYYTAARRYEFYFRVVKTIFYERAQRVS